jgi:hypothetical protein
MSTYQLVGTLSDTDRIALKRIRHLQFAPRKFRTANIVRYMWSRCQ